MKKMIVFALCGLVVFMPICAISQEDIKIYPLGCPSIDPLTPQTASFMKYGAVQENLHKGTVGVEIPIYRYTDDVFDIPISISYSSSGYMPNRNSGPLGTGWFLNVGGIITREVRGIPDEKSVDFAAHIYGYKDVWRDKPVLDKYCCFYTGTLNPGYESMLTYSSSKYYETTPDIFTFSFLGHAGSFCLMPDGSVKVFNTNGPAGEYQVIPDFQTFITFTIITGDGYKYIFGRGMTEDNWSADETEVTQTSFLLTKIIAPNSENVSFEYTPGPVNRQCTPRAYHICYSSIMINQELFSQGPQNPMRDYLSQIQHTQQLSSITIRDRVKISFSYDDAPWVKWDPYIPSEDKNLFWGEMGGYYGNDGTGKEILTYIYVKDLKNGNKRLRSCDLQYRFANGNKATFLNTVRVSGTGVYKCKYYKEESSFPPINTFAIDWWGYYNGRGTPTNFLPEVDSFNRLLQTYTARDPDPAYAIYGMLHTIEYPTGGSTEFLYEGNDYSQDFYLSYLQDTPQDNLGGGLRIKKIIQHTSSEQCDSDNTRTFEYRKNGKSSGIRVGKPHVYNESVFIADYTGKDLIFSGSGYEYTGPPFAIRQEYVVENKTLSSYDSSYSSLAKNSIEYDFVTEHQSDGSTIEYDYYSKADGIDLAWNVASVSCISLFNGPIYQELATPCTRESYVGKINRITHRNSSGDKVFEERYEYTEDLTQHLTYKEAVGSTIFQPWINCEVIQPKRKVQTWYYPNADKVDSVFTSTAYDYNKIGQNIRTDFIDAYRTRYSDFYQYVTDLNVADRSPVENAMISDHVLNLPLKRSRTLNRLIPGDQSELLLSENRYIYSVVAGNDGSEMIRLAQMKTAKIEYNQSAMISPEYETVETYDVYDLGGRILQTTDKAGLPTTYIWGHGGLFLVAKIVNCTVDQAAKISGISTFRTSPFSGDLPDNIRTLLYNHSSDGNYKVTVYSYQPFWGISRIMDFAGRSSYFQYNDDGKLISVKDDQGNLVQEYEYHTVSDEDEL